MSLGFGGAAQGDGTQVKTEADLEEINTEQVGFLPLSGDHKLKLLPTPWPTSNPPPPSASLLSVAAGKGLVAAAGPDALVLAKTESLRQAYREGPVGEMKVKAFQPEVTLPMPGRVSQVVFSSDESCLVIAAEQAGGLAVYDINSLTSGGKEPAFQIGMNGAGVRQLLPNPNLSAELAHIFGVVLESGQLLLADLKSGELVKTSNGTPVFHENVTSACWSRLGKQIVAGKQDGTAVQVDPKGAVKAQIPVPPQLTESMPLMSVFWLDTNEFLLIHTSGDSAPGGDMTDLENSVFHLASRAGVSSNNWTFRKIPEPTMASVGNSRTPSHHFIQRLKDWPPNLEDLLFLLSTGSSDVGMMTKSKVALDPSNAVTGIYTTTVADDSRRAGLPLGVADDISETSAIGVAMDMSVKELAPRPIPTDETMDESPVPLPALYVLNNEGMLSAWYVVYNESLRQKMAFPDLIAVGGPRALDAKTGNAVPQQRPTSSASSTQSPAFGAPSTPAFGTPSAPAFGAPSAPSTSAFGASSAPSSSAFGAPSTPAFGKPSAPAFGAPSAPAFGSSNALGSKASPWGTPAGPATNTAAAPKPAFGSSTPLAGAGTGFGQVGGLGMNKTSVWGTPQQSSGATFGQPSTPFGGNAAAASPFMNLGNNATGQKPATSSLFGGGQPMASFGAVQPTGNQASPFGAKQEPSFGSTATLGSTGSFGGGSTIGGPSLFGTPSQNGSSSFGKPSLPTTSREETMEDEDTPVKSIEQNAPSGGGLFGAGFKLGSTFKGDGTAKDDLPKPKDAGAGFFGGAFGNALGETEKKDQPITPIKKEPDSEDQPRLKDIPAAASTTPAAAPKASEPSATMPKRLFGDVPPTEVPAEMPKRVAGDVPPSDVPAEMPKRRAGDIPPTDIPGDVPPTTTKAEDNQAPDVPVAGSPPIDLGNEKFSEAAGSEEDLPPGPEDDDDEEDWEEEGEEGEVEEEDDGGDDEEDEDDDDDEEQTREVTDDDDEQTREVTDPKAHSAFEARMTPASPKRAEQPQPQDSTTPATEKKQSHTPAGFPKAPFAFVPTSKSQESPRSPSPVRSVTAPFAKPAFGQGTQSPFAKPTFGQPSQTQSKFGQPSSTQSTFGKPSQTQSTSGQPSQSSQPQRIAVPPAKPVERAPPKPAAPDAGSLEDQEDARVQEILSSDPEPTKELPLFLAHQNYAGEAGKAGIGGQIERVYRDVNSMLDTFGLNARALQGFVDGHIQLREEGQRTETDLENEDLWVLDDAEDMTVVLHALESTLETGKIPNPGPILHDLHSSAQDSTRLRLRTAELVKQIKSHTHPDQLALQDKAPLPTESQSQQTELRQGVQRVQQLLGQVEEVMSLLRADLASAQQRDGRRDGAAAVPTVEAVTNTILKMTGMIEQRSGDIDVLEREIRRLPGGLASLKLDENYEDQLVTSMAGSRITNGHSPALGRSRMLANGDSGMLGSKYRTPPSSARSRTLFSPEASRLGMSSGSRRKITDVTAEEIEGYRARTGRRRKVLDVLREAVEGKGARVVKVER